MLACPSILQESRAPETFDGRAHKLNDLLEMTAGQTAA
jgi:hypothetical protein